MGQGVPGLRAGPVQALRVHGSPGYGSPPHGVLCSAPSANEPRAEYGCRELSLGSLRHMEIEKEVLLFGPETSLDVQQEDGVPVRDQLTHW